MWVLKEKEMKFRTMLTLGLFVMAAPVAKADFKYDYQFSFPTGSPSYTIDNWYVLESAPGGVINGYNLGLRIPNTPISSPIGGTLHADFPVPDRATSALILGITHDLPGDAAGQKHIVLAMDPHAASLAEHIAWGTLFRTTLEDSLIADLQNYVNPDPAIAQSALQHVNNYAFGDATTGILDALAQSNTAFFNPNAGVFTIESWSDGTILGTGTVTVIPVPEPVGVGALTLGCVAILHRRKRI